MAITFQQGAFQAYETDNATGPVSTYAIPFPSTGLAVDDMMLSLWAWDTTSTTGPSRTLPSGWTSVTGVQVEGTGSTTVAWELAYHFVTSAEVASPPASIAMANGAAYEGTLSTSRFRGVDKTTPFAMNSPFYSKTSQMATQSTTKTSPSITTIAANAMLVAGMGLRNGSATLSGAPTTGYTLGGNTFGNGGRSTGLAHKLQAAAGSSGVATWTVSASLVGYGFQTALNPAPEASGRITDRYNGSIWVRQKTDRYTGSLWVPETATTL